jgi:hypothetical protein
MNRITERGLRESFRIRIENSVIFPNEIYIMHEIDRVLNYSSDKRDRLVDHNAIERSVQEIVSRYYNNSDECFITNGRSVVCHNSIIHVTMERIKLIGKIV